MCESPYTMEWERTTKHCPNLIEDSALLGDSESIEQMGSHVHVDWGGNKRTWPSLAHVWSEWYSEYVESEFPRLIVRFEDLLFHPEYVVDQIRQCSGADWRSDRFVYSTSPVKTNVYFEQYKAQTGYVSAILKYGKDYGQRIRNMTDEDVEYAKDFLNSTIMQMFGYHHP